MKPVHLFPPVGGVFGLRPLRYVKETELCAPAVEALWGLRGALLFQHRVQDVGHFPTQHCSAHVALCPGRDIFPGWEDFEPFGAQHLDEYWVEILTVSMPRPLRMILVSLIRRPIPG